MKRAPTLALFLASAHALDDGSATFYDDATLETRDVNSTAFKVELSEYVQKTGARCLDGTPGVYYFRKGEGSGANKWYIHHQGGGWCETWDDCLGRSKGGLGSSSTYGPTMKLGGGYFDTNPAANPMMYNWNIAYLKYCDGGSFSGNNESVTMYNGTALYYRGKRVREAMFDSLMASHSLGKATDVVVSGCSAGGLATFLHTDWWCDSIAAKLAPTFVKCVGMPDSVTAAGSTRRSIARMHACIARLSAVRLDAECGRASSSITRIRGARRCWATP